MLWPNTYRVPTSQPPCGGHPFAPSDGSHRFQKRGCHCRNTEVGSHPCRSDSHDIRSPCVYLLSVSPYHPSFSLRIRTLLGYLLAASADDAIAHATRTNVHTLRILRIPPWRDHSIEPPHNLPAPVEAPPAHCGQLAPRLRAWVAVAVYDPDDAPNVMALFSR